MSKSKTVDLMFDGVATPCTGKLDGNGEFLFTSVETDESGAPVRFKKFPAAVKLVDAIAAHNEANKDVPITPEVQAVASQEALDQLAELLGE